MLRTVSPVDPIRLPPIQLEDLLLRALVQETGASTVHIAAMFWSGSTQTETNEAVDAVISSLVTAYRDAGVELPAEIRQLELGPGSARALERLTGEHGSAEGDPGRSRG